MIIAFIGTFKKFVRRNPFNYRQLAEGFLATFFVAAFVVFFWTNIEFPNTYKGDTIKASYVLYAIPALVYFGVRFLMGLSRRRWLLVPILSIIGISIIFNLHFGYF